MSLVSTLPRASCQDHCRSQFCSRKGVYLLTDKQKQAKTTINRQKSIHIPEATVHVLEEVHVDLRRMTELAAEKGASSWLTALPIKEQRLLTE